MQRVSIRTAFVILCSLLVGTPATGAQAQGLVSIRKMSAALANEAVGEAVAACARNGYALSDALAFAGC
jgi:hypothetical protein